MPKMKSHSGAKKRFKRTATGKIRSKCAWTSHRLISKEKSAKRRNRGTMILAKPEGERIKRSFLPYAR